MTKRKSEIAFGVKEDAESVASQIVADAKKPKLGAKLTTASGYVRNTI